MIDFILALITNATNYINAYDAVHVLPFAAAAFIGLVFTVFMPLMVYVMRETPEQTIERVMPIVRVYDKAMEDIAHGHKIGLYTDAQCQARVDEYKVIRQAFADELVLAYARQLEAAKKKGAKQ
jgi:hypothetical protein